MSLSSKQMVFSKNVAKLINYATEIGVDLTFGEVFRTQEQQQIYFDTGRSKTMNSNHLRRLAVDFNFFIDGELFWKHDKIIMLGEYWESLDDNNRWGGNFKSITDSPHFEMNV